MPRVTRTRSGRRLCQTCGSILPKGRAHQCKIRADNERSAFRDAIGKRVKAIRQRRKMTLEQAAKAAGVGFKTWWRYEGGIGPLTMLEKAAKALDCRYRDLLPDGPA